MPSNNLNQQVRHPETGKVQSTVSSSRNGRKAAGTRWGTVENWREASKGAEKTSTRHGHAIRDGAQ